MSVRNGIVLLLAVSTLVFLPGCGSSNSSPTAVAPPSGAFSNSNLNGTYVFSVSGDDLNGYPYAIVGTITANGSGGNGTGTITGGTIDIVDSEVAPAVGLSVNNNGQYQVGPDGRGTVTIGTAAANPFGGNMTFDFVLQNSFHGLITEFDTFGSGSGTIDAQTSGVTQASLTGTYAFSFSGGDGNTGYPLATVGNFTIGSGGAITAGIEDFNDANLPYANEALVGTVLLGPSATTTLSSALGGLTFDVYAIDATHLKFIETDSLEFLSGDAYSQTSATVPTGALAFTLTGYLGAPVSSAAPFAAGGFLVTDGNGNISGSEDENDGGSPSPAAIAFTGTYTADGSGRFTLTTPSPFVGGTQYAAYPSSGGLLMLEIDSSGTTSGAAYLQSTTAFAASQGYAMNLSGVNLGASTGSEAVVDDIAEFTATGSSSSGTATGILDENYEPGGAPVFKLAFSDGSYGSIDATGRYGISADVGNNSITSLNGGFALTYYSVDGTTFPFIESDSGQVSTGVIVEQNEAATSAVAAKSGSHLFVVRPLIQPHALSKKKKL